jgi:hypothetical protein
VEIARAPTDTNRVAASVISERDMQGLMDIANPMSQRFERQQPIRIRSTLGSEYLLIAQNRGQHAFWRQRALFRAEPSGIPGKIQKVLGGADPRMIRKDARFGKVRKGRWWSELISRWISICVAGFASRNATSQMTWWAVSPHASAWPQKDPKNDKTSRAQRISMVRFSIGSVWIVEARAPPLALAGFQVADYFYDRKSGYRLIFLP